MSKFSELLTQKRIEKKLKKSDVAYLFGWSPMYYGRFENGHIIPSRLARLRIIDYCKGHDVSHELILVLEKKRGRSE